MKNDTQHLEFLISQYVDGTLDAASRKTLEQEMLTDPVARELYKEQRETQDLLDDLGSRIPLINWNEFEAKLALRLEHEVPGERSETWAWRRWARPMAIAASLLLAAGVGYTWHAMQGGGTTDGRIARVQPTTAPVMMVRIEDVPTAKVASSRVIDVQAPVVLGKAFAKVDVFAPSNDAGKSMYAGQLLDDWERMRTRPGAVAASALAKPDNGDRELLGPQ